MLSLKEFLDVQKKNVPLFLSGIESNQESGNSFSGSLGYYHKTEAVSHLSENNFKKAKDMFSVCGLIDKFRILKYNTRILEAGLNDTCCVIISDNEELINQYAKLRYKAFGKMPHMDVVVSKGRNEIWCNTVQFFMENNTEGIERNLNIIEMKLLKKLPLSGYFGLLDYHFYKALWGNEKAKMEEILEQFVSPKIHVKRNDNAIFSQYFSFPATAYAKLAWRKGIEVEVNSPFVPKELLPITPLDSYEVPYNFLKY